MVDNVKSRMALLSPRIRKYGLRFVVALVLFTVLGFFVLPPVVRYVLVSQLSEALHRPVAVKNVNINPYKLSATIDGLEIREKEGDGLFAGFDSLQVNLQSSSLFRWGAVVQEIKLLNPKFHVIRTAENRYNFSDLLDEAMAKPKSDGPPPAFSLNNIQISGGTVEFDDRLVDEKHVISDIGLTLPFISNMGYATDTFVEPHFSAKVNGAPLDIKGKSKPFAESRDSEFVLALDGVQIATYFDYSPVKLPLKIESGTLDTDLSVIFRQEHGADPKLLLSGKAEIKALKVNELSGQPLLSFKQLDIGIAQSDLLGNSFAVERVSLDSPEVSTRVSHDGKLNWLELLPKDTGASKPVEPPATAKAEPPRPIEWSLGEARISGGTVRWQDESNAKPVKASIESIDATLKKLNSKEMTADFDVAWKINGDPWLKVDSFALKEGKIDLKQRKVHIGDARVQGASGLTRRSADGKIEWLEPPALRLAEASHSSAPWAISIGKYSGEGISARFEDAAVSPKTTQTLEGLSFEATNLTTEPDQAAKFQVSFKYNSKGSVAIDGELTPAPLKADLNLDVKTVELLPLQPYFADRLNLAITRGQVTLKGNAQLQAPAGAKDASGLKGAFAGQLTIGDFNAVDKLNSADFLRWKSFYIGKADVKIGPESVSIGEVALSDFFARVIVSPEGKLNLLQIVRDEKGDVKPAEPAPVESAEGKATAPVVASDKPVVPVKVGKITVQGGNVRFSDNFVKPNYTANLRQIGGSITGLSSDPGAQASLELRGSYDNVAPLSIAAKINPLSAKPYLDLQAEVKGIELTSLSTYSGKYAGYEIDKGKLSVSVKYKIENDQLEAENRIFLDQLTFGNAVDSPDAVKLPVRLAVSLLKNSRGEIDVNLPVSGSLNDPQFSVGGLVVKVIVNLLSKAITSPFALIGSMFGGGEELSNVEFDYGRAALTPDAVKRLENLAKALVDKPDLSLEIEGRVDPEQDPEGLKQARIDRKVRALKRADIGQKNAEGGSAQVVVSPEEYPALLERVYREEKFPKPRNMIGLVKSLPVEEMEKLILAHSTVDEDDLRDLGDRRAKTVRDWLVQHEVPAERIFLLPSKITGAEGQQDSEKKVKNSRADFSLKLK